MAFDIEAYPYAGVTGFDIEIGEDPTPTLAEGTTLAALEAGSASFKYTVTIEGYGKILTDATPQQAVDAWYGEDGHYYEEGLGGLYVSFDNQQQLDWKNGFTRGGHLTLHVMDTGGDTLAVDTHKAASDATTELAATIDRDDTTITVKSTTGFDSSGDAWIGTECFGYTGTTATTFTGCTRGKYAPAVNGGDEIGFAQHHRVGEGQLEVLLQPAVTSSPVPDTWPGRWVVVRLHKYDASIPALNSKDDALVIFAGKIVAITDDPSSGATVVEVKHALDVIAEASVGGRDQWSGKIRNTINLKSGMTFRMKDFRVSTSGGGASEEANELTVEIGAAGDNEVEEGEYTIVEVYGIINTWLAKERAAGRLLGTYSFGLHLPTDKTIQSYVWWSIPSSSSSESISFELQWPQLVAARLGYHNGGNNAIIKSWAMSTLAAVHNAGGATQFYSEVSPDNLTRYVGFAYGSSLGVRATVDDEQGTFRDQWETLPSAVKPSATSDDGYGVFLIDEKFLAVGYKDGEYIYELQALPDQFGLSTTDADLTNWRIPWRQDGPEHVSIRQIFVVETTLQQFLLRVLLSTGTSGYNHATYDSFPYGLGLAIPYEICSGLIASTLRIPHPDKPIVALIDKATRLSELLTGELAVRFAFLRWNNEDGSLEFETWRSPTESNTVGTLTEANKAAPAGNVDHHRSVTTMDGSWAFPIIKIQYNRSLKGNTPGGADGFRDSLTIVDKAALDNAGGDGRILTLSCLGTFGDFASTGSDAKSLAGNFMATMPYFSRPARRSSRSIDQRHFIRSIGDIMLVTDAYARDPDTGLRGVSRYGIVTRHRWSLGGFTPNIDKAEPQGGDVDLFFLDHNRVAAYVPAAQVDDTETNGGYTHATATLICYEHKYSESAEAADVSHLAAGYKVRIVEIDPDDPAAPLSWDRIVDSTDGASELVLTAALSSPAWDATKKYRVIFDDYTDAVAAQQVKTFQADDADHKIADARIPYEYGIGGADSTFTLSAAADPVELPPNSSYGDGVGRDVSGDIALGRLLNNLMNYKTSVSSPCLTGIEMAPSGVDPFSSATWWCIQCRPVWLGGDALLNDVYRKVAVAPHFASQDGTSASVRVTLSRTRPTGGLNWGTGWLDVDRGSIISQTTFTTTSTTYSTPTPVELDARVKDGDGRAWVYVEVTLKAKSWGLAHLQVTGLRVLHDLVSS